MTWAAGGLVQASDLNTMLGGNPTTTANTLNATWATGGNNAGYGQTAVANVAAGDIVSATPWNGLFYNTKNSADHQGTSISSIANVSSSNVVTFYSAAQTNLNSIYASRGNAGSQGSTVSNSATVSATWTSSATFTANVNFANGDAARYFFNAGGQIAMTASHPNTTAGVNQALSNLCSAIGTVVISGPSSGAVTIAGTSYNGVTKVGGSGSTETLVSGRGYFGLTTSNVTYFDQNTAESPYATVMDLTLQSRGVAATGSNGDNGNVVHIIGTMRESGANGTLGAVSSMTCTVRPPSTTYIANTWGTITINITATQS